MYAQDVTAPATTYVRQNLGFCQSWFLVVPCPLCRIRECKAGTTQAVGSSKAIDIGHTIVAPCHCVLHPYTRYAGVTCAGMLCCAFVAVTVQLYAQLYELIAVRVACGSCMLYPCIMYVGCLSLWAALLPACRRVPVPWRALACFCPSVQPVSGTDGTRRNWPCHNLRLTQSGILSIMACWFFVVPCPLCSIRECKADATQGVVGSSKAIDIGHRAAGVAGSSSHVST